MREKTPLWFRIFGKLSRAGLLRWMPDEPYLKIVFRGRMGQRLNLKDPKTFNEKLQWLKLHDRKPIYTTMVDKYAAKKYVAGIIGEEHIIPTLGVWDRFEEIDFDSLPERFVLKCTHDSGGLVICRNKKDFDFEAAKAKIEASLKTQYYYSGREWPYKNVRPRIIAEKYLSESDGEPIRDYKFFCFGGQARCMKVDFDRFIEHHANYFDMEGNLLPFGEVAYPPDPNREVTLPENAPEMQRLSEILSKELPFLRVDFYDSEGNIYFGELTFYPMSGYSKFTDQKWDIILGSWIKLPGGGYAYLIHNECIVILSRKPIGLIDYKFYCFNGKIRYLYVSQGLEDHKTARISFLTPEWEFAAFARSDYAHFDTLPDKPSKYDDMLQIARQLSKSFRFLRVDLYCVGNTVYFSELTFTPCSGYMPFEPLAYDKMLGEELRLDEI